MDKFNLQSKIDFALNLSKHNIYSAYQYLIGVYEENKNYLTDVENLKLILSILEFYQRLNSVEDISFYFKKALEYSLRYNDQKSISLIYRYYCQFLYKRAKLDKCNLLVDNFVSNFSNFTSLHDILKFKEIDLAIKSLLKEEIKDEDSLEEILNKELEPDGNINILCSYIRKYLGSLNEEDIIKLFKIFDIALKYIVSNKDYFKIYHFSLAELHNLIGNIYYYFGLFNKSLKHFLRAFMNSLSRPDVNLFAKYQKNISIAFYELGQIEKANKYFVMIEKLYKKIDDPIVLNQFYSVLGLSYLRQGKFSLGHSLLKSAINYRMSIKDNFTLLHTLNYAIIFSLDKMRLKAYYYFLYFEKIVKKVPDNYYYLYYLVYLKIFRKKRFNSELFIKNLLKYPVYSLRIIPCLSLCLKYKIKITKNEKFISIISFFLKSFRKEIGEKIFELYKNQFIEFSDIFNIDFENIKISKISSRINFDLKVNKLEFDWKEFINDKLESLNEKQLIDIFYLKISNDNDIVCYRNKKYKINFQYQYNIESKFIDWTRKILFNRIYLEKIILTPMIQDLK